MAYGRRSADAQMLLQERSMDSGKFTSDDVAEQGNVYGVYNDFNNRSSVPYSSIDIYNHDMFHSDTKSLATPTGTVFKSEYVATPTLGEDWKAGEAGRSKQRNIAVPRPHPVTWFQKFRREGACGMNARFFVFFFFFFFAAIGVTLYFVIPRAPSWAFDPQKPLESDVQDPYFTRQPIPAFSFDATLNLAVDARSSWIPLHFKSIALTVKDLGTQKVVGEAKLGSRSYPGRKITHVPFPFTFNYTSPRSALNDTTFNDFYTACGHIYQTVERPSFDLSINIKSSIIGIIGSRWASTSIIGINCPVSILSTQV